MSLVDTCGWIEWLTDGVLSDNFAPYFAAPDTLLTPTLVQFELYKWTRRNSDTETALEVMALTEQTRVVPLSTAIALQAADLTMEYRLSFPDAIIYACARFHQTPLITSDSHFEGLPDVVYFRKE